MEKNKHLSNMEPDAPGQTAATVFVVWQLVSSARSDLQRFFLFLSFLRFLCILANGFVFNINRSETKQ